MLRIGLTGGVGSGKTEVAQMFAALGAGVVDTDVIAREVVAPGTPGLAAVVAAFGDSVLAADGTLDRRMLRERVFAAPALRKRLESILHPLIREQTNARLTALREPYALIVVPLLVETEFGDLVDRVLVVDCPEETQLTRVMQRDRIGRAAAEAILAAQTDRATRLAAADDRIDNGGSLERTGAQVASLHERYLKLARDCRSVPGRAE